LYEFFDIVEILSPTSLIRLLTSDGNTVYTQFDYNYTYVHDLEKKYFDSEYTGVRIKWMHDNWWMSVVFSVVYIVGIFGGQRLMKDVPRFTLQKPLILWNMALAVFSIIGSLRMIQHLAHVVGTHGLEHSICELDFTYGVAACWAWLFVLSKAAELIDTVFIVLRKQKLIFLHWYHHASVLISCWYAMHDFVSTARWFSCVNYSVHALMYSYYAARAMKLKIPKWVNILLTTLQISQMIWGIYLNYFVISTKLAGRNCSVSQRNIVANFFMYFTYFLLFSNYFYHAYLKKSPVSKKTERTDYDGAVKKDE
jgi:elongation of very long chain fatty acids protein 6